MKTIKVSNRTIGQNHPCFIVAEIGINHNGNMDLAKKMIDSVVSCGADGVKFQNYKTVDFISNSKIKHKYRQGQDEVTESQLEMFKRYEISETQLVELKDYCDKKGIVFFSTPTGPDGLRFLESLGVELLKNGSDFLTNVELIGQMAKTQIATVLSVGMSTSEEIEDAVTIFRNCGGKELILLHCTSTYPTPTEEINLSRIQTLSDTWNCIVGFSDHSEGSSAAIGAVYLGARFIEKHFTLDNNLSGPDHWFSANPDEFAHLVSGIRKAEKILGNPNPEPTESEIEGRKQFRLSCVAASDLQEGNQIGADDVVFRRPGTGILPKHKNEIIGKVLKCGLSQGDPYQWSNLHV